MFRFSKLQNHCMQSINPQTETHLILISKKSFHRYLEFHFSFCEMQSVRPMNIYNNLNFSNKLYIYKTKDKTPFRKYRNNLKGINTGEQNIWYWKNF